MYKIKIQFSSWGNVTAVSMETIREKRSSRCCGLSVFCQVNKGSVLSIFHLSDESLFPKTFLYIQTKSTAPWEKAGHFSPAFDEKGYIF